MTQYRSRADDSLTWARRFERNEDGDSIIAWSGNKITWTRMFDVLALVGVPGDSGHIRFGDWVLKDLTGAMSVLSDEDFRALYEPVTGEPWDGR